MKKQLLENARPQYSKEVQELMREYRGTKKDEIETFVKQLMVINKISLENEIEDCINEKSKIF